MRYGWVSLVPLRTRQAVLFAADVLFITLALIGAVLVRFDFTVTDLEWQLYFWSALPVLLAIRLPLAIGFGLYRWSFRFASVLDLLKIFYTVLTSSVLAFSYFYFAQHGYSRGILIVEGVLSFLMMGGVRFGGRVSQAYLSVVNPSARPALLMGDPGQVDVWVRTLARSGQVPFVLRGAICHGSTLVGRRIQNLPVIGLDKVEDFLRRFEIREILVISDSVSGGDLRKLIELAGPYGIRFRRILTTRLALLAEGRM
ncbi:MAG: hypothetical protein JO317_00460, partial [Verrucomicrobiae bacterium]|nr:hypothetical protein [Verrucomicrobiae bacterium]